MASTAQVFASEQQLFFDYALQTDREYALFVYLSSLDFYYPFESTGVSCPQLSASMPLPALRWLLPW